MDAAARVELQERRANEAAAADEVARVQRQIYMHHRVEWALCGSYEIHPDTLERALRTDARIRGRCNACGLLIPRASGLVIDCPLRLTNLAQRASLRKVIEGA